MSNKVEHIHYCTEHSCQREFHCERPECRRLRDLPFLACDRCYSRAVNWFTRQAYRAHVEETTERYIKEQEIRRVRDIYVAEQAHRLNRMSKYQRLMYDSRNGTRHGFSNGWW